MDLYVCWYVSREDDRSSSLVRVYMCICICEVLTPGNAKLAIVRKTKAMIINQYFQLIFTYLSSFFLQKISEQLSSTSDLFRNLTQA